MRLTLSLAVAILLSTSPTYVAAAAGPGVGAQYDTTHVYVAPADFDRFVASIVATFGGTTSKRGVATVTPTPSRTISQVILTPVGPFSVFGYETPIPYPFGQERTGYLVTDMDAAIRDARAAGADIVVAPFDDPIGRDAIIQWPGGVAMQLYWHKTAPHYAPLRTVPENRLYLSPARADAFIRAFSTFAHGKVTEDAANAPGIEIGRPGEHYRRVRLTSPFGKALLLVSDGRLPYPFGRELTGYEVSNLADSLAKAQTAGAQLLASPYSADGRHAAIVAFPGGYIAELHDLGGK
jgi:hypothetical protein